MPRAKVPRSDPFQQIADRQRIPGARKGDTPIDRELNIYRAGAEDRPTVANLLELYMYDFSRGLELDVRADGRFGYEDLNDYWRNEALHPFLFQVDGKLAGFALVQHVSVVSGDSNIWDMEEFFVMAKYRRLGIATQVTHHLWNEFPGKWEIRVLPSNERGLRFWTHAIRLQCSAEILPTSMPVGGKPFNVFEFRV